MGVNMDKLFGHGPQGEIWGQMFSNCKCIVAPTKKYTTKELNRKHILKKRKVMDKKKQQIRDNKMMRMKIKY